MAARIFLPCLLLLLTLASPAHVCATTVVLGPDDGVHALTSELEYLVDPDGRWSVDALRAGQAEQQWVQAEQDVLSFGYSSAVYWVRFRVDQSNTLPGSHLVEIAYPVLDQIDAYLYQNDVLVSQFQMGDRLPYAQRPVDHPNFVFPLETRRDAVTDIYVRVQSTSSVQIPINLYHANSMVEQKYEEAIGLAIFYGAMAMMAMYNLLLLLTIRDISYFYYVMWVLSVTMLLAGINGLPFKYFWPEQPHLNDPGLVMALSGMIIFPCLFFRSFLAIPQTRPTLAKILLAFSILGTLTAIGGFFLPYRPMIVANLLLIMVAIIAGLWAGIVRWLDGYYAAKYFNIAWISILIGGFILVTNKLGLLPRTWLTEHAGQLGSVTEVVLLSFALADRMNYERRKRAQAQREAAAAQQELLDRQIHANENLDRLVRQRTEELEKTNARLKEVSATDGLTNLLNRRAFEEMFQTEHKRAYREKTPLAVLMIDLDHFKRINDQHGHPFGDLCLIKAADMIRKNLRRPSDIAARYGGEEFILLLPSTDLEGAVCVADNIREALVGAQVTDGQHQQSMTASIGVASQIPDNDSSREMLLKAADLNLYAAKENGRNQVVWDTTLPRTA